MSNSQKQTRPLPGDPSPAEYTERMIRVNHAGEYGAKRIYAGQLAVLKDAKAKALIQHMADQEEEHLRAFDQMVGLRQIRPTLLMPLWHVGGFMLGAATAMLGTRAAMACTVAVEKVIDEHYAVQQEKLDVSEKDLREVVTKFRADEKEHHDTALEQEAEQAPFYPLLHGVVTGTTKLAIWLSTRI